MNPIGIGWRHPHYRELLARRPALGFLEVHSENFFGEGGAALAVLAQGREHYAISLHGVGLALGSAEGIDAWHLAQLAQLVQRIEPVRVSDHACFARAPLGGAGVVHAADLLPIPFSAESLAVLAANVQRVQERLKRPLLVENLSAYLAPHGSDREEADFLDELATRTGCGLLVDVNNLYVNALNAGLQGSAAIDACTAWLDRIAPRHVGELHVAGHCAMDGIVIDDHGSRVCDAVWAVCAHAVARFANVPVLVEWDTGIPALDVLLDEAANAAELAPAALACAA